MNKLLKIAEKLILKIEESPTIFTKWIISFLGIITIRILVEGWIGKFHSKSAQFIFYDFAHNFLFFLITYLLFLVILNKLLKIKLSKLSNVLLWGFLIILTPPIIDNIISKGKGFWSFYKFDGISGLIQRFFTFFGDKPEIGITYGVRVEVAIVVLLLFVYSFIKIRAGRNNKAAAIYSAITAFVSYLVFFILGTFPSYITILLDGFKKGFLKIGEIDVAQMFLTPVSVFHRNIYEITTVFNFKMSLIYVLVFSAISIFVIFIFQKEKLYSFLKNIRVPQIIYHVGLLASGLGLGILMNQTDANKTSGFSELFNLFNIIGFLVLAESVILAWLASVIANDLEDKNIDKKTNAYRPLIQNSFSEKDYKTLGIILFIFSLFFSSMVNLKIMLLLAAYQAIAWVYSAWPLRLKRFAFISTFVSAIASILIFFSGYILASPLEDLSGLSTSIMLFLIFAYTFSLPIKDFKDIEGDKADRVYTVPVVFGEYWGKIIVGSGIFISFLLSVLVFNESRLFWWALILGGISFWLVNKMPASGRKPTKPIGVGLQYKLIDLKQNPRQLIDVGINYQNIFWWILGTVSIYGIILVKIIFK